MVSGDGCGIAWFKFIGCSRNISVLVNSYSDIFQQLFSHESIFGFNSTIQEFDQKYLQMINQALRLNEAYNFALLSETSLI